MDLTSNEIKRFARHLTLPEVGLQGQLKLKKSSVLVVGAGGLGSPILLYLAAAGVGHLGIVDGDIVDISNLQRQVIHSVDTVGSLKCESARNSILSLNPNCTVDIYPEMLSSANACDILSKYDVVCDATDNFPARFLISDTCSVLEKPIVYGSVQRFEGQVSVFNLNPSSPTYRDFIPSAPPPGHVPSCAEAGVMGVLPGLVGILQASEAIKILLNLGKVLDGRLLVVDLLSVSFSEFTINKSSAPEVSPSSTASSTPPPSPEVDKIDVVELSELLSDSNSNSILIDVRSLQEREISVISGSLSIPLIQISDGSSLEYIRDLVLQGKKLFVHCKAGGRSLEAVRILNLEKIPATDVEGGIDAWTSLVDQSLSIY